MENKSSVFGKNVLLTGASTGIGRATAILISRMGGNILMAGRTEEHLQEALRDVEKTAQGKVSGILADLDTEEGVKKLFEEADSRLGKLDILINNAGLPYGNLLEGDYKEWQEVVNTNLLSYIACSAEAIKRMNENGHIVNIGSMSADVRESPGSLYTATKAGIQAFSESLRKQVNKQGIKVTLIEPGAVDTDMQEESAETKKQKIKSAEMLTSDDIAQSILFCLSQPKRCDIVLLQIRPHRQFI